MRLAALAGGRGRVVSRCQRPQGRRGRKGGVVYGHKIRGVDLGTEGSLGSRGLGKRLLVHRHLPQQDKNHHSSCGCNNHKTTAATTAGAGAQQQEHVPFRLRQGPALLYLPLPCPSPPKGRRFPPGGGGGQYTTPDQPILV